MNRQKSHFSKIWADGQTFRSLPGNRPRFEIHDPNGLSVLVRNHQSNPFTECIYSCMLKCSRAHSRDLRAGEWRSYSIQRRHHIKRDEASRFCSKHMCMCTSRKILVMAVRDSSHNKYANEHHTHHGSNQNIFQPTGGPRGRCSRGPSCRSS